jgi:hypothetical protein
MKGKHMANKHELVADYTKLALLAERGDLESVLKMIYLMLASIHKTTPEIERQKILEPLQPMGKIAGEV